MKKGMWTSSVIILALSLGRPAITAAKDPKSAAPANWSGKWTLDFGQSRNLPSGLDAYRMSVQQGGQELKVETSYEGGLHPVDNANGQSPSRRSGTGFPHGSVGVGTGIGIPGAGVGYPGGGVGYPRGGTYPGGGHPGGGGYPDDSTGDPGGPGGRAPRNSQKPARAGITAVRMYPPSATYKLDGSAGTAQLGDSEQTEATSRAESSKNGAELKLSLTASGEAGQKGDAIQLKDQWKFSKDGQYLIVDRSVHAPEGSGAVHLVFHRQDEDSGAAASPAPSK